MVRVVGLAVTEACANVAVHAYRDRPVPGDMVVEAVAGQDQMHVTVVDHGSGLAPRFDSPGIGMGLPLMSQLCRPLRGADHRGRRHQDPHALQPARRTVAGELAAGRRSPFEA